jgi:hypothetical protein
MPYHIESDNESCNGFAVVKDSDGEVMGCHRNEDQASRQMAALYAAEDDAEAENYDEPTHTMPDGTVMAGDTHPREVSHTPTDAMVEEARLGLDWRQEFNRGGTEVGVARARDIANRRPLSHETVVRMASFFARHEVDKEGQGFTPDEDGYPSAGRIAWALWGGDPGKTFADAIMRETEDDTDSMPNRTAAIEILARTTTTR